jgi:hypothetical protein
VIKQGTADVIKAQLETHYSQPRAMVCRDVYLAGIRNGNGPTWPNGSAFSNHAKVVMVDNSAFYMGSENLYPARLQELGMIVEDPAASRTLTEQYNVRDDAVTHLG